MTPRLLAIDRLETPIGALLMVVDEEQLCALEFAEHEGRLLRQLERRYGAVRLAPEVNPCGFADRLRAYFAGELRSLDAIPVHTGGTPFQRRVWQALRGIPPGETRTYGALAAQLAMPAAARAVGAANGQNPVSIVVPCHRLIGAGAALVKYGGLERKAWLLRHEGLQWAGCREGFALPGPPCSY
ncbi:MAG TPA: methylated-DNA--[protein]-cysteine S-methyltransferase [Roseiflexaceae bacterium]|nr:methylated-DNA--[protein]-cysteine S-methyltransferase [Roseiflexaceae bacterium]